MTRSWMVVLSKFWLWIHWTTFSKSMYHRRFLPQSWGFHWKQAPGCWPLQKKFNMKMCTNTRIFALFATRISNFKSSSSNVRIKMKIKMEFVDNIKIERWLNVETEIRMILWIFCCVVSPSQWFSSSSPAYQTHWTLRFERMDLKKDLRKGV